MILLPSSNFLLPLTISKSTELPVFKCTDTVTCIKMVTRILQAISASSFPCLAVVSWGWATCKQFKPLKMDDDQTVWATPQGSH